MSNAVTFSILTVASFVAFLFIVSTTEGRAATTPFERMDSNRDKELSKREYRGPQTVFQRLDRNRNGLISRAEAEGTKLLAASEGGTKNTVPGKVVPSEKAPETFVYVDTHNHVVSGGVSGRSGRGNGAAESALAAMDAAGVKLNLIMPMPQTVTQKNRIRAEDILPLVKQYPGRFAVLGGGGSLNVMIQEAVQSGGVTDKQFREFDVTAESLIKKGVVGFGEMTAEHFSMREDHPYVSAPPDHPLFLRLVDLAAKYDVPVDLHMEAIPEEMPPPSRLATPPNPAILKPNIPAFERLLAHNRRARVVWVHFGWDSTGQRTVELTRSLLSKHPNLFISIRVAGGMQARNVTWETFPLDGQGNLKKDWLALFQEFSDRFVIGSDEIVLAGDKHPSAGSIQSTTALLKQLPSGLQRQIGYENAYRIYKLPR